MTRAINNRKLSHKLLIVFTLIAVQLSGQTNRLFDNGRLRFGNGSENSINTYGNLQQPWYHNGDNNTWYKLTYSSYPLDIRWRVGGDGTNSWNIEGDLAQNPVWTNKVDDLSGFTVSNTLTGAGYGTIKTTGEITINSQLFEIQNTYTLLQPEGYIEIKVKITNVSESNANNVRLWVGTRDDWVGNSDGPTKERGNLVNNAFQIISNMADQAKAIKVFTGQETIMFYSNSDRAYTTIDWCCSFANAADRNPATNSISLSGDGSYAMYVRFNDLAVGASDELTWYYAAGTLSEINDIISAVASASGAVENISYSSADYRYKSSASGTSYYILVPNGSTVPTAAQIEAGIDYSGGTIVASGNSATTANVDHIFNLTGLTSNTSYVVYGVTKYNDGTSDVYSTIGNASFTTAAVCVSPTAGGTISETQTICSGSTPNALTSSSLPSGHTGTLEYQWQSSTTSSTTGFSDIGTATSTTYQPGNLTVTTWYKRLARVDCMSDWTGAAESNVIEITVNLLPSAPTAGSNSYTYDGTIKTATANTGSGETVDWYAGATGTPTVLAPSGTNVGTYSAYAEARNSATGCISSTRTLITLAITKAMVIAWNDPKTKVYGDANPTLTYHYTGFKNGESESVLDIKPIPITSVSQTSDAGTYPASIGISGGLDNNYNIVNVPATFTVTKALLAVKSDSQTKAYGEVNPVLTFGYNGWKNNDSEPVLDTKPTATTTVNLSSPAGTYTNAITVSGGADNNYDFSYQAANFEVTKAMITVTITAAAKTKVYGDANPVLTFDYSGWKNGDDETVLDTKPTASTTVDLLSNVGTYTNSITVSGGADNNYTFSYLPTNFTVTKATLTTTADAKTKAYSDTNPELTFVYSGWKNGENETVLDTKPTASTTVDLLSNVGTHTNSITVSGGADNNYAFSYVPANFTVTKATLTITAAAKTKVYGDVNPDLTVVYSGWKNGDDQTVLATKPTVGTTVTNTTPVGVYTNAITVSGGVDENYAFSYVPADFEVTKAMLTVTADAKTKVYGGSNPTLTFGYSGWKNGENETVLTTKPTAGTTVTNTTSVGVLVNAITVSGGVDENYTFSYIAANFEVTKAKLSIQANATNKVYDGSNKATVTGGQLVGILNNDIVSLTLGSATFDNKLVGTNKVVTVTGSTISGTVAGNYSLTEITGLTANITPKQLTITSTAVVKNKMFDNNTTALIQSIGTLQGVVTDDLNAVNVSAVANYNDATVGVNKTITAVFTINGSAASNYIKPVDLIITGAKISEKVILNETIVVPSKGECQGGDLFVEYTILKGTPTEYRIIFDAAALAAGFANTGYLPLTSTQSKDKVYIKIPANIAEGVYLAKLQFKNELNDESLVYSFQFSIKLSKDYLVKKFNDVILCNNSSKRFTTYQWYKNGQPISGATSQFYNELSGLDGIYSLQVGTKDGAIIWSCEIEIHTPKIKNATISAYPNPAKSTETFTVKVTNLTDQDLKGAVMRIYSIQGSLIQTLYEVKQVNSVKLPFGEYIGTVITTDQKKYTYKITVVNL